jgi:hypothetical protein
MVLVLGACSQPRMLLFCDFFAPLLAARSTIIRKQVFEERMLYNAKLATSNLSSLQVSLALHSVNARASFDHDKKQN